MPGVTQRRTQALDPLGPTWGSAAKSWPDRMEDPSSHNKFCFNLECGEA